MRNLRCLRRTIGLPLAALMLALSLPMGVAQAALVTTEQAVESAAADSARAKLAAVIAREDVRSELRRMGIDPQEAAARVDGLSDAEAQRVAARIDQMPAGQDAVGVIVGAALIIFLVLLITDLLGYTDVFPFIKRSAR